MPAKSIIIFVVLLFTIIGFLSSILYIYKIRSPQKYKNTLFTWTQYPIAGFKYERESWVAQSIHSGTVILLGFITFFNILRNDTFTGNFSGFTSIVINVFITFIMFGSIASISHLWGTAIATPVTKLIKKKQSLALSTEGILMANFLFPWKAFSYYSINVEKNLVSFSSSVFPELIVFIASPQSSEQLNEIVAIIENYLPIYSNNSTANSLTKYRLPFLTTIISIFFILIVLFVYQLPINFALIINSFFINRFMSLAGKTILDYILKAKSASLE